MLCSMRSATPTCCQVEEGNSKRRRSIVTTVRGEPVEGEREEGKYRHSHNMN